ncbi:MAG: hypothetical protein ABIT08_05040 [Bacteroidia bacterium]
MDKNQSATLNSFDTTNLVLGNYELVWIGNLKFASIVNDKFEPVLSDIRKYKMAQEVDFRGLRENKLAKQASMAAKSFKISNAVQAMASDLDDNHMYRQVNYSPASLMSGREENCVDKARIIEGAARKNIIALGAYGVVIAEVDAFKESIDAFEISIPEPDNAINAKKDATRYLKKLFPRGRTIIEKSMRKAAGQYKESSPEFYSRLIDSFDIKGLPTQHTDLDFFITEKESGNVLPGVKVTASPVSKPAEKFNQYSNMAGEADYKIISPELYNVTFEFPDRITVNKTVAAKRGKKIEVSIEMEKK